jgi:hypothetical protein
MHAGEQLVDHLEGGALPCGIAELIELCRHRIERRPCFRERRRRARSEDRQLALRGALRAAGDRRVQIMAASCFELLGQTPRDIRIHGRGRNKDSALGQRFRDTARTKQNGLGLRGIDHHANDNVGILGGFRRCLGALAAIGDEAGDAVGRDVAAGHFKAGAAQRGRHAHAHRAQPDHGHARFCGFGHAAFPLGASPWAALRLRRCPCLTRLGHAAKA